MADSATAGGNSNFVAPKIRCQYKFITSRKVYRTQENFDVKKFD